MTKEFDIPVTQPFLPPIEEVMAEMSGVWKNRWLTNSGPIINRLEGSLAGYFGLDDFMLVGNGTIALQLALHALDIEGEVITTPFSYVATTSSLLWEKCIPRFVDVDPDTLNISPSAIEAGITTNTTAILATHVFGMPCDVDAIQVIAHKHGLKVIYDAAHCFGSIYKEQSVIKFGDISTISFHATKLFHTVEGGGIYSSDPIVMERLKKMRNFGHSGPEHFAEVGINAKNSEVHSAFGLVNLRYVDEILLKRKQISRMYIQYLEDSEINFLGGQDNAKGNASYFPILLKSESKCVGLRDHLATKGIQTRRYFYPLLSSVFGFDDAYMPIAKSASERILCLPVYHEISDMDILKVSKLINDFLKV